MTIYSNARVYDKVGVAIAGIDKCAYFDRRDGCRVVNTRCWKCGEIFSEEEVTAKLKVACGENLVCLACDEDATGPLAVWVIKV